MTLRDRLIAADRFGDALSAVHADRVLAVFREWLGSDEALRIMVDHQRLAGNHCFCGWQLDTASPRLYEYSHPGHVLTSLAAALDRKDPS